MLDPIGIKVLQLHLVVMQQPPKELVGEGGESSLVEVSEGHDVAIRRQSARREDHGGQGPPSARGDFRVAPWLHWKMGVGGCELDDG